VIPPLVVTERLRLRLPSLDDAAAIFASYACDPDVTRYLRWKPHMELTHTVAFLQQAIAAIEARTEAQWVIERRAVEGPIGMIGLRFNEHGGELGYVLERRSWHQGYATEAARAVVDQALAEPVIHRVWAVCDVEHRVSALVLEKTGMAREGLLRRWEVHPNVSATPRDCWCYARVKE
jgi:RimJ/RimL family protein N-acetyltransferase